MILVIDAPYNVRDLETKVFKGIFYIVIQHLLGANNKFYVAILTRSRLEFRLMKNLLATEYRCVFFSMSFEALPPSTVTEGYFLVLV